MEQWSLSIQIGSDMPYDVPLTSAEMTVGRGENADIRVDSNLLSRRALQGALTWQNGVWYYEDLDSPNGTVVDGVLCFTPESGRVGRVPLKDGSILDIDAQQRGESPNGVRMRLQRGAACSYSIEQLRYQGETLIGRSKQCDIVLPKINVSRKHAVIRAKGDGYELEAFEGTAGVFVNYMPVSGKIALVPRDVIYICGTLLMFAPGCLYRKNEAVGKGGVVLQVRDIVRKEKGKLNHVNFDVHKGELVAIIGGSGAGKSTLLNAISGAVRPYSGTVLYNGQDLFAYHDMLKSQIGFVPQKDVMHQRMSLKMMLDYAARLRLQDDVAASERAQRVDEVMKELSIDGAKNTSLMRVSGGQRKRASIAIEMLSDPELFFLDEPTSGLDPGTERHLLQTLREFTRNGKTVILVTHTTLTLPICDKVVIMGNGGNMCYYGDPEGAKRFFGVNSFVDIFDQIGTEKEADACRRRFNEQRTDLGKEQKQEKQKGVSRVRYSTLRQIGTLTSRYLHLILNEPGWLAGMLLCVPILTLFVSFVSGEETFVTYANTYKTLFTLICVPVFVGLLTANGEICKERDILYREYTANLHLGAYLASKLIALLLLNAVQSVLLAVCFCVMVQVPGQSLLLSPPIEMTISLFLTMYSTTCLGLLVSAVSPTRNVATSLLSVLLVPQVVFSGAVFELEGLTRAIANGIHAFWGTNSLAISFGMERLDMKEVIIEKGMQAGVKFVADTPYEDYLASNLPNLQASWLALVLLGAACAVLCYVALRLTATRYKD